MSDKKPIIPPPDNRETKPRTIIIKQNSYKGPTISINVNKDITTNETVPDYSIPEFTLNTKGSSSSKDTDD